MEEEGGWCKQLGVLANKARPGVSLPHWASQSTQTSELPRVSFSHLSLCICLPFHSLWIESNCREFNIPHPISRSMVHRFVQLTGWSVCQSHSPQKQRQPVFYLLFLSIIFAKCILLKLNITSEAAALLPARSAQVVILIWEHIAPTEGAPSPQPDMARPSLITAFTPPPANAPGSPFFWKLVGATKGSTQAQKTRVLDNSSWAGSAIWQLSP